MEENLGEKFTNKMDYLVRNLNVIKKNENDTEGYEAVLTEKID